MISRYLGVSVHLYLAESNLANPLLRKLASIYPCFIFTSSLLPVKCSFHETSAKRVRERWFMLSFSPLLFPPHLLRISHALSPCFSNPTKTQPDGQTPAEFHPFMLETAQRVMK